VSLLYTSSVTKEADSPFSSNGCWVASVPLGSEASPSTCLSLSTFAPASGNTMLSTVSSASQLRTIVFWLGHITGRSTINRTSEFELLSRREAKLVRLKVSTASFDVWCKTSSALTAFRYSTSVVILSAAQLQNFSTIKPYYMRLVSMQYKFTKTKPHNSHRNMLPATICATWSTHFRTNWLSYGFMFHPTQNMSFCTSSSQPISWLTAEKLNQAQQKQKCIRNKVYDTTK